MKLGIFVLFACVCTISFADDSIDFLTSSTDHLTQALTGLASNVAQAVDVGSLVACGDETTFANVEAALGPIIDEAATCNPTRLDDIQAKVTALVNSISETQKACFDKNPEGQKLLTGLGVFGLTPDQIKSKVASYVFGHILTVCGTLDSLSKKFKGGDFTGFGTDGGKLAVAIFKDNSFKRLAQDVTLALMVTSKLGSTESLAALLGGAASVTSAKGADVATTVKCTDEPTAQKIISTITSLVSQGSTCDLSKAAAIATQAKALIDGIPAAHKQCFNNDPAIKAIGTALGVVGVPMDKIVQKALAFALGHFSEVCNTVKVLNSDVTSGNWNQFGADGGKLIQKVLA